MTKKSLLLLNKIGVSPIQWKKILHYFPDVDEILSASRDSLVKSKVFSSVQLDTFFKLKKEKWLEKELEKARINNIEIIDIFSSYYPSLLKEISHPPLALYVKGKKEVLNKLCFAIVGTRLATVYGLNMAESIAFSLASLGFVIVSGLARGIDTYAHRGALRGGETIAILGSGLLFIYPKENVKLAEEIIGRGALVSEFFLDCPPSKRNFPQRNRIISGISKGVLVVEAPTKSGAMITARLACEQNREVFALPGEAGSATSKGTHLLIKEGAKLVDSIQDILEELNFTIKVSSTSLDDNLSSEERVVFDIIGKKGMYLDELVLKSKLGREIVLKNVLSLQMKGLIKEIRPLYFIRTQV